MKRKICLLKGNTLGECARENSFTKHAWGQGDGSKGMGVTMKEGR